MHTRDAGDFELVSNGPLAIVCFRYSGKKAVGDEQIDEINAGLLAALERDGRVFITGTKLNGRQVIRACIINHRTQAEDMDYLLQVIRELARETKP